MFRLMLPLALALASATTSMAEVPYYRHAAPAYGATTGTPDAGTNGSAGNDARTLVATPPPAFSTRSGNATSTPLNISGGKTPYAYSARNLPAGIEIVEGTLRGSPSATGNYPVEVTITDSSTPPQARVLSFGITVTEPLSVSSDSVVARAGMSITPYAFSASHSVGPVRWAIEAGSALPSQLTIDPVTGLVTGRLSADAIKGAASVVATDALGAATGTLTVEVIPALAARSKAPSQGYVPRVGIPFTSAKPEVDNLLAAAPKSWALVSAGTEIRQDQIQSRIGAWAQFDEKTGVLTGTPAATQAKLSTLLLRVTDTDGGTADTQPFSLEVQQPSANLMAWGWNGNGQLGVGGTTDKMVPTAAATGYAFSKVRGMSSTTCGLAFDGAAYCWGAGRNGALGNAKLSDSDTPVAVVGGHRFADIAVGAWVSCGLRNDGAILCWGGSEGYATLGDGTTTISSIPKVIGMGFVNLHQGFFVHCGTRTDGATYCWGPNFNGQLGDGTTTERTVPVRISGNHAFVKVQGGYTVQCGLRSDGVALCWGRNATGLLGNGTTSGASYLPTPVVNGTGLGDLVMGAYHACGLKDSGWVCWGDNSYGQIGDGTTQPQPRAVPGMYGVRYSQIALQASASCGLTASGSISCWGLNYYGGLGKGDKVATTTPTLVPGSYSYVAAGHHQAFGLLNQ